MDTILIVEDEESISNILAHQLEQENLQVVQAFDGEEALEMFADEELDIDLILLDWMLPKVDGLDVCRKVREVSNVPIIMLTAKDSEIDKVLGLEIGADDYVTKPYNLRELVARIKANLRRKSLEQRTDTNEIKVGHLIVHQDAFIVSKRGEEIELTHREFELINYLAEHLGQVMRREDLLETVWGYDYFGDVRTVDVTVRRLREKVEDNPSQPEYIMTRRGVGYFLKEPEVE